MIPVKPKLTMFLLPSEGVDEVTYADDQPQYMPLPTLRTADGRVISQWTLEPNERLLLENGVPITLMLHTFNEPLQPIVLTVGGLDLRTNDVPTEQSVEGDSK